MAMPWSSAAWITSASRTEPPGWITAVAPASIATRSPSANGKNASEATRTLGQRLGKSRRFRGVLGLAYGDPRRVDPAHLSGADADGGAVFGIHDGVRLDVLGHPEGEAQIVELGRGRRALGDGAQLHLVDHGVVARLHQQAARHGFDPNSGRARIAAMRALSRRFICPAPMPAVTPSFA